MDALQTIRNAQQAISSGTGGIPDTRSEGDPGGRPLDEAALVAAEARKISAARVATVMVT